MPRVLFVEPYYGGSHRAFLDGLVRNSQHHIDLLTLPDGEWRRRMRRGAQELATASAELSAEYDALIVSDMLDLPAFLALTRPRFAAVPVLAYFHENQFTYPRLRGTKLNSWFGQINYLTALAANRVAFNSEFHRADFLSALRQLAAEPNNWLMPEAIAEIEGKSSVLPVGIDLRRLDAHTGPKDSDPPLVLWNHRWDFDKAPELFVAVLEELAAEGARFSVAIAGEPGENPSPALLQAPARLGERLVHHGYAPSFAEYAALLWRSRVAVSTSRQEFFGVATVEAMYCGCVTLMPDRLNYPHLVPPGWRDRLLWNDAAGLRDRLRSELGAGANPAGDGLRAAAVAFDWTSAGPTWDAAIEEMADIR